MFFAISLLSSYSYSQFQISDGTGGNAEAQANAVFVGKYNRPSRKKLYTHPHASDPFANVDLATVDAATVSAMQTMREAAEDAETAQFDPAIAAATGDAGARRHFLCIHECVLRWPL